MTGGRDAPMRLFDTLRREVVPFRPRSPGRVSIYACGATVHGPPHLGHLRSAVDVDVLRRWLAERGNDVLLVRNTTDIDDKIFARSAAAGRPWWEWGARHERAFSAAYDALGCLSPSLEPRAGGHVTEAIELIERLLAGGHAYVDPARSGDVLFEVTTWPDYGDLSGQQPTRLAPSAGSGHAAKRGPLDFTLWKSAKPGEPSWPSRWGRGRPSWHVECSAMSTRYLGPEFDLHCGGRDLVFPHHENERAQSMAAGDRFAGHWMHHGWVTSAGQKMSKSLGNAVGAAEVLGRARPVEVRYYLLAPHYRSAIDYSGRALGEAATAYRRIEDFVERSRERCGPPDPHGSGADLPDGFRAALDDDLATPTAVAVLHAVAREGREALDHDDESGAGEARRAVVAMLRVLGLGAAPRSGPAAGPTDGLRADMDRLVGSSLARRARARAAGDFALADALREELAAVGITVRDTAGGTRWERAPRPDDSR